MADHHFVKVVEVSPGSNSSESLEYVQLQMTSSGQRFFGGTNSTVTLLDESGTPNLTTPVNADVANGQSGRRVLIGVANLEGTFPAGDPDFEFVAGNYLDGAGGGACFTSGVFGPVDCVTWGSFAGTPASPTGGNTAAIADTMALVRRTPSCGPGLIDTNNPSNWVQEAPDPFNNAQPATTGTLCPNTTLTKTPKKKTTKRLAKFEFAATLGVDNFQCKLDNGPFKDCDSPFKKRVKVGKHKFKVQADGDLSPASYGWKVVKKK